MGVLGSLLMLFGTIILIGCSCFALLVYFFMLSGNIANQVISKFPDLKGDEDVLRGVIATILSSGVLIVVGGLLFLIFK